ncbi:putative manganese efflux pump [Pigmentiphaga kullae]|uniref:Putative manganese efflux pump n=1 Tax=Pigmentiphaga kullae TaxID=151784 RepID=A0A4Q7NMZ6_9BURK|nr:manganese efflux pump [Pigmentiphaga kullae]RZS86585.1 putative manganese efflux pump [Pigmentiphaga kullae]
MACSFVLLAGLGGHIIYEAARGDAQGDTESARKGGLVSLAITGLATSIDAMEVGVGLAFVDVNIFVVAAVIGLCTCVMVTIGILAGRALSALVGKRAEMMGGVVLIGVGATILYEHLRAPALV